MNALDHHRFLVSMEPCRRQRLEALVSSLFRNQSHRLQELSTRLRATQQPHMLGPALGEGLPVSHLSVRRPHYAQRMVTSDACSVMAALLLVFAWAAPCRTAKASGAFSVYSAGIIP